MFFFDLNHHRGFDSLTTTSYFVLNGTLVYFESEALNISIIDIAIHNKTVVYYTIFTTTHTFLPYLSIKSTIFMLIVYFFKRTVPTAKRFPELQKEIAQLRPKLIPLLVKSPIEPSLRISDQKNSSKKRNNGISGLRKSIGPNPSGYAPH